MKLIKLRNGEPVPAGPSVKFTMDPTGSELLRTCICGAAWTVQVPPEGKRVDSYCPRSCGGGVEIDRRPEIDWLDLPPMEDTLRDLTYRPRIPTFPQVLGADGKPAEPAPDFRREYLCEPAPDVCEFCDGSGWLEDAPGGPRRCTCNPWWNIGGRDE